MDFRTAYKQWVSTKLFENGLNITFTVKQIVDGVRVDFMLTNKPILGLDVSENSYNRGFMLDFDALFPGSFHKDWVIFTEHMVDIISGAGSRFDYSNQKTQLLGNYSGYACRALAEQLDILNTEQ